MKIIGNAKKDYFDYLIHQYGVDPLVILDRRPNVDLPELHENVIPIPRNLSLKNQYGNQWFINSWLVLNGCAYELIETSSYPSVFVLANESNTVEYWLSHNSTKLGVELPQMVTLSKSINKHCFIISNKHIITAHPNLVDLGFSKIKDPMQVYLETVDFISRHLSSKPEVAAKQTNKEKIVGHGFDLKTSFRGK